MWKNILIVETASCHRISDTICTYRKISKNSKKNKNPTQNKNKCKKRYINCYNKKIKQNRN